MVSPTLCLSFVLPRLTFKYKEHWPPKDECCPRSFWVSECRLADLSSRHRTLSSDHNFMPHSAAMPHCIRKPLCLPGPQPLCPSVFVSHLLTAGIRHAPLPGDVPTCHAMSSWAPEALAPSELGSGLEITGTGWRHERWFCTDHFLACHIGFL